MAGGIEGTDWEPRPRRPGWPTVPPTVRRPSAVELAAILRNHQSQRSDMQVHNTVNTPRRSKRTERFVSVDKVNTF